MVGSRRLRGEEDSFETRRFAADDFFPVRLAGVSEKLVATPLNKLRRMVFHWKRSKMFLDYAPFVDRRVGLCGILRIKRISNQPSRPVGDEDGVFENYAVVFIFFLTSKRVRRRRREPPAKQRNTAYGPQIELLPAAHVNALSYIRLCVIPARLYRRRIKFVRTDKKKSR